MDDPPSELDDDARNNDGTCQFCPAMVMGADGGAYDFDGVDDCYTVPHHPDFNTTEITMATWLRVDTPVDQCRTLIAKPVGGGTANSWELFICPSPNGQFLLRMQIDTTGFNDIDETVDPGDAWGHYAGTFDGQAMQLFHNGQLLGTEVLVGMLNTDNGSVRIGCDFNSGSPESHVRGELDDVRIYSRALTEAELTEIYLDAD